MSAWDIEYWLCVPGKPGYQISTLGNVRSLDRELVQRGKGGTIATHPYRGGMLKQKPDEKGYLRVKLGKGNRHRVHQLVLKGFVGPRPDGEQACHFDDEKPNNRLANLRWDSRSANELDKVRNGRHHEARKTECKHGHKYTPENTYVDNHGKRACRECARLRQAHNRQPRQLELFTAR